MKACLEKHGHLCICGKKFARNDNLKRHFKSCQGEQQHGGGDEKAPVAKKQKMDKEEEARPTNEKQEPEASRLTEQDVGSSGFVEVWPSTEEDDDEILVQTLEEVENNLKQKDQNEEQEEKIKFKLTPCTDKRCKKFGLERKVFSLRLAENENGELQGQEAWKLLEDALQKAIAKVTSSHKDENALFVAMSSNRLHHTYHSPRLTVGDWRHSTLPARRVWDMMSAILNSNESFQFDDSFHTEITVVETPSRGSGRMSVKAKSIESLIRKKKSVVQIKNNDEPCCARSIIVAKAKADNNPQYETIKRGTVMQTNLARQLHKASDVPQGPCGLEEIKLFEDYLKEYQIIVISADHGFQSIFRGPPASKILGLLKTGEHFHAITSLRGFFGRNEYCVDCGKSYQVGGNKRKHNCQGTLCQACFQYHCPNKKSPQQVLCSDCGRSFKGEACLMAHRTKTVNGKEASFSDKPSISRAYKKCQSCKKQVTGKELKFHKCWHALCPSCKQYVDLKNHKCFIQVIKEESEDISSTREEAEELSEGGGFEYRRTRNRRRSR